MMNTLKRYLPGSSASTVGNLKTGFYEEIGHRPTLEDRVQFKEFNVKALKKRGVGRVLFFAVYDGHGGEDASVYLHKNLHTQIERALDTKEVATLYTKDAAGDALISKILAEVFAVVDAEFFAKNNTIAMGAGSTATTLLILDDRLIAANVGDSRVLLSRGGLAVAMTNDHKPSDSAEKKRITSRGGFVMKGRVCGELAVSRAFGDFRFKSKESLQDLLGDDEEDAEGSTMYQALVVADPEVKVETISSQDEFLILSCDGLFEVSSNQEAVDFVRAQLVEHGDPAKAAHAAASNAVTKGSRDNVSVLIVMLHDTLSGRRLQAPEGVATGAAACSAEETTSLPAPPPDAGAAATPSDREGPVSTEVRVGDTSSGAAFDNDETASLDPGGKAS